ncbi:MAG TPA: CBS domain-containing protein [Anaeromyxobacteraceae bacterium]|jgi:CBS domain-containing protein
MATIEKHVTREVQALDDTTPCAEAARLMGDRNIGSVAVRRAGRLVGLVTERDLVARVLARGAAASTRIVDAMRTDLPTVSLGATERECADLMKKHSTRHLLVAEGGEVRGVISMRDVIQLMLDEKQFLIDQLQTYIDGR